MTNIIDKILLIVNIVFFVLTMMFHVLGVYELILGHTALENLLKKLHIPLTYNQVVVVSFVSLLITGWSYIAREKLNGRM